MSTRAVAAALGKRFPISHATVANFECGRSVPGIDVLAALADLFQRPINWFLTGGRALTGVRYRNLKSRVRVGELHRFEADVQRWLDLYVNLETRLDSPLTASMDDLGAEDAQTPDELAQVVRRKLGLKESDPVPSVVEVLEQFGIRVLENPTDLRIDGLAAKYGRDYVVVLNPRVSNDRVRLSAAHELAHVLLGDCEVDGAESKAAEQNAFEFASQFLLPNGQLKRAFEGRSMVRLVQFKEKFGISLAAMIYRAQRLDFIGDAQAKWLWIEFSRRGWRANEPGYVRPDRATRLEQLIEEAVAGGILSLKELADSAGARPEAIRQRLDLATGIRSDGLVQEEFSRVVQFTSEALGVR